MSAIIIETVVSIVGELLIVLLGVLGAWLTLNLNKRFEVQTINAAQQEVIAMAQITVGELNQTVVDRLKEVSEDGKLSAGDIKDLGVELVNKTIEKLSDPTYNLLQAAGVDIIQLIRGVGEDWIANLKKV